MAAKVPLTYNTATGNPQRVQPGDTIDPTYLPPTAGTTQRTFAYWTA